MFIDSSFHFLFFFWIYISIYLYIDLKRHYYIHTLDKPYRCPRCRKGFSRRDALKRHQKSVAEGKKVQCNPSEGSDNEN